MRYRGPDSLRRGRYAATCSEGFCRGATAGGTSGLERGIFDILNFFLPDGVHDVPNPADRRTRADMLFRESNGFVLAIEYDGAFWHEGQLDRDLRKSYRLHDMGVHEVMRIREEPLEPTSGLDVCVPRNPTPQLCAHLVLAHLLHTIGPAFEYDTIRRIEGALYSSALKLDSKSVQCSDCRKVMKYLSREVPYRRR